MKELNDKIIEWLKQHNIDKLSPDKQYLKIIEEVGELARGLLKNDLEAIKDAIGDIYVALVGLSLQYEMEIKNIDGSSVIISTDRGSLTQIIKVASSHPQDIDFEFAMKLLKGVAYINGYVFKECVDHAYNQVKDRDIKIIEGVAVK